jgi:beta-lactamase regulating signal transducer with metallopeptidase domain
MAGSIDAALSLATQHLWQSAVLFGLALLAVKLRALNAETRSWLLLAIFALATIAPFATLLPDTFVSAGSVAAVASRTVAVEAEEAVPTGSPSDSQRPATLGNAKVDPDTLHLEIPKTLSSVLALVWLLGSIWQSMRLFEGWNQARRLRRSARAAPALEALMADALPLGTSIAVTAVDGPLVAGLLRPRILVPRSLAETLDDATLRGILLHEIAHIRRGDLWLALMQRAALAVFWWSPFLRSIGRRLELAREMACDARAAKRCGGNVDYAGTLLASVEKLFELDQRPALLVAGMFGRRSHLDLRIDGLIEDDDDAVAHRRILAMGLSVAALVCFGGLVLAATPRVNVDLPWSKVEPEAQAKELLAAVRAGDVEAVRRLAKHGVDLDARVGGMGTALMQATWKHDLKMIDALLDLGADPDRGLPGEGIPLLVAPGLGYQSIVERLVEAGADVNLVDTDYAETPLIVASREGHLTIVKYLVGHGANVNQGVMADWEGRWRSPLNQASDPAVREYLIGQGATTERQ